VRSRRRPVSISSLGDGGGEEWGHCGWALRSRSGLEYHKLCVMCSLRRSKRAALLSVSSQADAAQRSTIDASRQRVTSPVRSWTPLCGFFDDVRRSQGLGSHGESGAVPAQRCEAATTMPDRHTGDGFILRQSGAFASQSVGMGW